MNIKTFSIHAVRNIFAFFIALGLGYVAYTVNPTSVAPTKVEAGGADNVTGFAWSENVGWISLNSTSDGSATSYGVNISPLTGTGIFSGYAWSENVGWITFNSGELTGCPSGACNAQVDWALGKVTGWARVLSQTGDGWIKLSDDTVGVWNGKGVKIDTATGKFSGFAWGSDSVGWISFNCSTDGSCASSNYFVQGPLSAPCTPGSCSGSLVCNTTTGACIAPNGACSTSADCGGGQLCNPNLVCVTLDGNCSTNSDCAGGQLCNASGKCVAPVGGYCNTSVDCFSGQICNTITHACYNKPTTKFWQF